MKRIKILRNGAHGTTESSGTILTIDFEDDRNYRVRPSDTSKRFHWYFPKLNCGKNEFELIDEENTSQCSTLLEVDKTVELSKDKGSKFDSGKAPIHMIPEEAILGTSQVFAFGAKKYKRFNYRKGIEFTRLQDSLMRHMLAFSKGENTDEESGLSHLYHAAANISMLIYMNENKPEMDDRDKRGKE